MLHNQEINFSEVSDNEILNRVNRLIQNERKQTHLILLHLNEIELRKLYLHVDCVSLFHYLTKVCGYSDSAAFERQNATRLLRKVPEVIEKLESGDVNLSQMARIESNLKYGIKRGVIADKSEEKQKALDVIEQVQNLNLAETDLVIAKEFDKPIKKRQSKTQQKDESVRLQLTLSKEQHEIFKMAQDLISHSVPNRDLADTITYLAKRIVDQKMGKVKDSSSAGKNKTQWSTSSATEKTAAPDTKSNSEDTTSTPATGVGRATSHSTPATGAGKRKHISIKIKRELMQKANYQCEFVNPKTKQRCDCRHQLQIDHRIPWSIEPNDNPANLRVLCAVHNQAEAKRWGLT